MAGFLAALEAPVAQAGGVGRGDKQRASGESWRGRLRVADYDYRHEQSRLRLELHDLEVAVTRLREEQRFYRHLKFGRDLQDIQMIDLLDRKRACETRLRFVAQRTCRRTERKVGLLSWVMLSPLIVAMRLQELLGHGVRERLA